MGLLSFVTVLTHVVLVACDEARFETVTPSTSPPPTPPAPPPLALRVNGNQLVDQNRNPVRLLGFNRSGTEYACVQGWGIFEGPIDAASIEAMKTWQANVVRLPLNEDCWLGIKGVHPSISGESYRKAIAEYVDRLHDAGLFVVLDLHWSAPGSTLADDSREMADADHSPRFWESVATYFRSDPAVAFDLFNEPHSISWECWRDGCTTRAGWQAAGMQSLIDAVRRVGATQPVIVGGLAWANDLSSWLEYRPVDPAAQMVAGFHVYNHNRCSRRVCWDEEVAKVAAVAPVVTGEFGQNDCAHGFIDDFMNWADAHGVSYVGWTWNMWSCEGHGLITSYDGTPTPYGQGLRDHLRATAGSGGVTPTTRPKG